MASQIKLPIYVTNFFCNYYTIVAIMTQPNNTARANAIYRSNLRTTKFIFNLTPGVTAFPECNTSGIIPFRYKAPKKFVVIQHVDEEEYLCSCDEYPYQDYSRHIVAGKDFMSRVDIVDETTLDQDYVYDFPQQPDPDYLTGVYSDKSKTFSIVRQTLKTEHCLSCNSSECEHVDTYRDKKRGNYQHIPLAFPAIIKHRIEYPLCEERASIEKAYESGMKNYPNVLIPEYDPQKVCLHGHSFSPECPIIMGWANKSSSKIHKKTATLEAKVYYRRVIKNSCNCIQQYEGERDLIF